MDTDVPSFIDINLRREIVRKQVSSIAPGAIANSTLQQVNIPGVFSKTGKLTRLSLPLP